MVSNSIAHGTTAQATSNGDTAKASAFTLATNANGTLPENDASRKRETAILPLEVGSRINCRWNDGKQHPVKVIERRKLFSDRANDYEYRKCYLKHPPGDEINRNVTLSMSEIDGKKNKVYGQNLCYLAKFFLDHKTLYYDVDLFLFYVLCECVDRICHMVGYFSKEKHLEESYNLACILTLPPYQRKGYGKFLIVFSYELSKKEGKVGKLERPLSDLGFLSYRGYWTRILLDILKRHKGNISIKELSDMTAIKAKDILATLQNLELIQYLKGQHVICADPRILDRHLKGVGCGGLEVDLSKLIWTPYKEQN